MLKNNNQAAVKRLGLRAMRQNRTRNLFAVLAIILTTFMFTTVFTIGFSLARNLSIMMLRMQGTKTTITLRQPDEKQREQAAKAKYLNAAGIRIPTGTAKKPGEDAEDASVFYLDYYDGTEFEKNYTPAISDMEGSYPRKEDELMLSERGLGVLDIDRPKLGMEIVLQTDSGEKIFSLSGWFQDYGYGAGGFQGFVSKEYADKLGLTVEEDGILQISAKTGRQGQLLEELKNLVSLRDGQEWESVYDVQDENGENTVVVIFCIGFIGLIIVLSGYLLIYNVMYISVTKDIRFYGMLKTIGTSPSQVKRLVKLQAVRLSLFGIPIGILLGTAMSFVAVPVALQILREEAQGVIPTDINFNPLIYIGTILFAIITVAVSCRKPAVLAGKVSVVEALKYNGQRAVKKKMRRTTDGGKIYRMAFRNVFREKKRAFLVFASLFMGTMAFLSVDTFIGSLKLENYLNAYVPNDYTVYIGPSNGETETDEEKRNRNQAAEKMAQDIARIDGVTEVGVNRSADTILQFDAETFRPFLENAAMYGGDPQELIEFYQKEEEGNEYRAQVLSVSSHMMEIYNERARQKIDIRRFEAGEICLIGYVQTVEQSEQMVGKQITIQDVECGSSLTLEVGACPISGEDYGLNIGRYWMMGGAPGIILMSEKAMGRLCQKTSIEGIIADCDADAETYVTANIHELVSANPSVVAIEVKSELASNFRSSMTAMNVLGAGISIVLILIGIINFINVMLTSVFIRRTELAVMESVGMTKRQVRKMLTYEGAYYGCISIILILTIGNVIIKWIADMACEVADYAVYHYPAVLIGSIAGMILVICMGVPSVVYHMLSKESVTERLRSGE